MRIWFDMDGTIADLYAVENWLPKLRAYDPTPYMEARPMLRLCALARVLNRLSREGVEIGVVSWLSKDPNPAYGKAVAEAKREWLKRQMPSVKWDYIVIVPHGMPKPDAVNIQPHDVLFDDEAPNRDEWKRAGGWAFDPAKIMAFLRAC